MSAFKGAFEALRNAVGDVDADRILSAVEAEACAEQAAEIDRLRKELDAVQRRYTEDTAELKRQVGQLPSRFSATPAQVDLYLRRILTEQTLLNYQWVIGGRAVEEAAKDLRMQAAELESDGEKTAPREFRYAADRIDPMKGGGHYPSVLLCGQHNGFGPCPGASRCTPRDDETGGAR